MASETEPETSYEEAPFAEEVITTIPVKVHIVAPSTLPEGYVFDAEVGPSGHKRTVTVEVVSCHHCLMVLMWRMRGKLFEFWFTIAVVTITVPFKR